MSRTHLGLICCLSFVTLEAFQAVYLGSVFQNTDSFAVGTAVFGISVLGCTVATAVFRPAELAASVRSWKIVAVLNLLAALTWITYFTAIQLIEPAVVFTVFSGMVPLATVVAGKLGLPEAAAPKKSLVNFGNLLILLAIAVLAVITVLGHSGFVRGGWIAGLSGVLLSAMSGSFTAMVILFSVRLNQRGVGPLCQFGLRFMLYTLLAFAAFLIGIDAKSTIVPVEDYLWITLVGLVVIAFPLYLVQKAIPLVHSSVIAAITALGPAIVFVMQLLEGRVDYSPATLAGLAIYMSGAMLAVIGATRAPDVQRRNPEIA
ncbi:hypothetical protein [uncultured Roseibium sp.]|uniref:hypothetical protein n=1 Tax=uncultured Roseibium sp. TaxID=1936171 RepID=UPI00262331B2|nr:hypothetical protein [uncultured Roseibium sp.]